MEKPANPQRLCSEIQLFDLCAKSACPRKNGRYCTDEGLLAKFEAINEEDTSQDQFITEEAEEMEEDELSYDKGVGVDEYDDEDGDEEY